VKTYYMYMMTNRSRVVLYTGVTNSLERRLWFHGNASNCSFTKRHKVDRLVCYETHEDVRDAISREKEIKGWRREKKNDLIQKSNPKWEDLGKQVILAS
jgi:putative endonuclease